MSEHRPHITIRPDGPYLVRGASLRRLRSVRNDAGRPVTWETTSELEHRESYALCRCGKSADKPYCDGSHRGAGFAGTETAERAPTASRQRAFEGPDLVLEDDKTLCVHAGFCVREHAKAWDLVRSAATDEERDLLLGMVANCPSGRLEIHAADGDARIEPTLPARIGVIDDGPLYVEGRIPVKSADGGTYEERNRVTLCRCGASQNKPFCDGSHSDAGFRDS